MSENLTSATVTVANTLAFNQNASLENILFFKNRFGDILNVFQVLRANGYLQYILKDTELSDMEDTAKELFLLAVDAELKKL